MTCDILIPVAEKGGVENVINMVLPYLQSKGWKVRVVQLIWEGTKWTADSSFFPLIRGRDGHNLEELADSYREFIEKTDTPDIVLATGWPYMCYVAKKVSAQLGKDWKVVSWLHSSLERYEAAGYGGYSSLGLADVHFAISKSIYNGIINNCPESNVIAVRNPVDFSKCRGTKKKRKGNEKHTLFFVGRISEEKRLDIIIKAIGQVKDSWKLCVIGDGESGYKQQLYELAEMWGVTRNISWLGWRENPWAYANDAEALVMASEYEGFPLTAIEALANGIPVISTPVDGIVELIKPGSNGYLYPHGDDRALAEILMAVDKGILPVIAAKTCVRTAEAYRKEVALADFECKLREVYTHSEWLAKRKKHGKLFCGEKISVILPCYNKEKEIRECIESLLKQTLPLSMLEFIFVDDASSDETCKIIREYEKIYPENILLVECEKNGHPGAARNIGLQYATGEYIVFVDSDDKVSENMIQKLYEKIALYQCDMASCGYYIYRDGGEKKPYVTEEHLYLLQCAEEKKRYILEQGCRNSVWAKIYRKSFLEKNNLCFPEGVYMEDLYFHEMCMMYAESCYVIGEPLYWYRENSNGVMFSNRIEEYFMDTFYMQEQACQDLTNRGMLQGYEQEFSLIYYVKAFAEPVGRMLKQENHINFDKEKVGLIRERLLEHFPDIFENPYVLQDQSSKNQRFLEILKEGE